MSTESEPFAVASGLVDPGHSTVTASPGTIPFRGTSVVGASVELDASGPGATVVQPEATGEDGTATGTFSSSGAGTWTISANVGGVAFTQQATVVVGPPEVAAVTVTPGGAALLVDQTVALDATALDDWGDPVPGAEIAWSSSDPEVAGVNADGVVTAVSPGSATITASSGERSGAAQVSVSLNGGTLTDVTYCTIDDVPIRMDVYLPDASKPRPLPVAVHVHGGGWTGGSKSTGTRSPS